MAEDNRRNHEYEESVRDAKEAVRHNVGGPILARKALILGDEARKSKGCTPPAHLQNYPVEIIDGYVLELGRFHGRPFKQEVGPMMLQVPFGRLAEQERNGRTLHEMMEEAISNPPEGFEVESIIHDSIVYREKPLDPGFCAPLSEMPGPRVVDQKRKHRDRKAAKAAKVARRRNR